MLSSIKAKLITFYLAILLVALSGLGAFLYLSLNKIVYNSIDASLLSRARAIATLISEADGETEFSFSDEVMWEYQSPRSGNYFQIRRLDGTIIEKSTSIGKAELPFPGKQHPTHFRTLFIKGKPVRLVDLHILKDKERNKERNGHLNQSRATGFIIQCAESIQEQITLIRNYGFLLAVSIFLVMAASASGAFLIAKKALMPIREITDSVSRISESNLSERIKLINIPAELEVLCAAVNRTFDRLENSFMRQKQFSSDASHELRTPLSVILSQSEIILRKERTPQEYKKALLSIEQAGKLMADIVEKLLTIARLGVENAGAKKERVDLRELITIALKMLRFCAEDNKISITLRKKETPVLIDGYKAELLELFVNIIDNAIKYNIPQGKIDISFGEEEPFVVVQVRDTGIGIDDKDLNQVFKRFYRADKSRSKNIAGIGLGLSICKEVVKLHGGKMVLKSRPGEGTTVFVYLEALKNKAT